MDSDTDVVVRKLLLPVLQELKIKDYMLESENISKKGDNYLGQILSLKVVFRTELNNEKAINFVLKAAPRDDSRNFLPVDKLYQREIYVYTTVLPAFEEFQRIRCVTRPLSSVTKCYNTTTEYGFEGLLFEDLKAANFALWDKRKPMDEEHASAVLRELARFHALSFAMRDQTPESFKKLAGNLDNIFKEVSDMMNSNEIVSAQMKTAANMLRERGYTAQAEKFDVLAEETDEILSTFTFASVDEPYSVIIHGDSWCNNFMFNCKVRRYIYRYIKRFPAFVTLFPVSSVFSFS